ncbi:hypothetical protein NHX12_013240 [Muraenolepis orangiensis]|uniref:Uncharacterized protein n=1 Tax=Muraenolepis orangiensis TaxID=630683 RepID=A0A9Q0DG12_9TELE|nr:hypothetical protein NHX12_013240 [Muraenolepis orangiensis]
MLFPIGQRNPQTRGEEEPKLDTRDRPEHLLSLPELCTFFCDSRGQIRKNGNPIPTWKLESHQQPVTCGGLTPWSGSGGRGSQTDAVALRPLV